MARNTGSSRSSSTNANRAERGQSRARSGAMTPEEAGHLGGVAPHKCRGFQCQEKSKSRGNR